MILVCQSEGSARRPAGHRLARNEQADGLQLWLAGNGSAAHYSDELLKSRTGTQKCGMCPYRGTSLALTDVVPARSI